MRKEEDVTGLGALPGAAGMDTGTRHSWDIAPSVLSAVANYAVRKGHQPLPLVEPGSPETEQYRTIKARFEYLSRTEEKPIRKIVLTSPGSGDGKTLTALNLALVLAQDNNKTVLMIDADLRKPGIRDYFVHQPRIGLVEAMNGDRPLASVLFRPEGSRLFILPSGSDAQNPAELLGSIRMKMFLARLAEAFDHIVIDTPPVGLFIDADVLAAFSDACLIIVRAGRSPKKRVARSVETMKKHNLIGIILNDVRQSPFERYYQYNQYYDYRESGR